MAIRTNSIYVLHSGAAAAQGHTEWFQQQLCMSLQLGGWKSEMAEWAGMPSSEPSLWLVGSHLLPACSRGYPSACVCVLIASSFKDTGPTGLGLP